MLPLVIAKVNGRGVVGVLNLGSTAAAYPILDGMREFNEILSPADRC